MFDKIKDLKLPLVSRKKLETQIKNNKVLNERRKAVTDNNIKLQKELNNKNLEIEVLQNTNSEYARKIEEIVNRCAKLSGEITDKENRIADLKATNKRLRKHIDQIEEALLYLESKNKNANKKIDKSTTLKQCRVCGKFFRVTSENSNRVRCNKCVEQNRQQKKGKA